MTQEEKAKNTNTINEYDKLFDEFVEELTQSCYDTHGEGSEQREIPDVVTEYKDKILKLFI